MNERKWHTATSTAEMLRHLRSRPGSRVRRALLFNCACCRRVWHLLKEGSRRFLETVEQCAATNPMPRRGQSWEGETNARPWADSQPFPHPNLRACLDATQATLSLKWENNATADLAANARARLRSTGSFVAAKETEQSFQCQLLRCLFGNPFHPLPPLEPSWLEWNGGIVPKLAWAANAERILPDGQLEVARLAVLADALEDSGCTNSGLLEHLRGPGPHARGCHVLAALLGGV